MFPQFIRAIREARPKSFIIENVKGLRNGSFLAYFDYLVLHLHYPDVERRKGEKWKEHRARLEKLYTGGPDGPSYKVISQVLNAANFGVGQRRERVFIVGVRADLGIEYSFPLATHTREALLNDQWVTRSYWDRHEIPASRIPDVPEQLKRTIQKLGERKAALAWRTVRDTISDLPRIALGQTSHQVLNHFLNPGARTYKGHDGSSLDAPSKTIKAGYNGVPGGENMVRLDDGSVRYFSVRECARLQAFPDEWAFDGSWCGCMKQIGNAVPVTLGEVVAAPLVKALQSLPE
jgi:DNA (cytosine-5)-methyltransferase 1